MRETGWSTVVATRSRDGVCATMPLRQPRPMGAIRLEGLIASGRQSHSSDRALVDALASSTLWVLGSVAGSRQSLLQATFDDRVRIPAFTRMETLKQAAERNPDWVTLAVFETRGMELMKTVRAGTGIIVNPWSASEKDFPFG
jgi:SseB protein N-terminal domain